MSTNSKCTVCAKPAVNTCNNCGKFSSCSKPGHSISDHQSNCFPWSLTYTVDSYKTKTKAFAATRHIKPEEAIFSEKPFLVCPGYQKLYNGDDFPIKKVCLGCYRALDEKASYKCKMCKLAVCNDKCQNQQWHKKFECGFVARLKVGLFNGVPERTVYFYITIIRFLLLKKLEPEFWNNLESEFGPFLPNVSTSKLANILTQTLKKLFKGMKSGLELEKSPTILAAIKQFGMDSTSSKDLYFTAFYKKARLFSHSCSPNTAPFQHVTSLEALKIECIALRNIGPGELLTQPMELSLLILGVEIRRKKLEKHYGIFCECCRCTDPTELESYFSVRKCTLNGCDGYLIPRVLPKTEAVWKCNNSSCAHGGVQLACIGSTSYYDKVIFKPVKEREIDGTASLDHLLSTQRSILKFEEFLHPNHFALYAAHEFHLLELYFLLENYPGDTRSIRWALKMVKVSNKNLEILNKLLPGISPWRARLTFYLSQGMRLIARNLGLDESSTVRRGQKMLMILAFLQKKTLATLKIFPDNFRTPFISSTKMIEVIERSIQEDLKDNPYLRDEFDVISKVSDFETWQQIINCPN